MTDFISQSAHENCRQGRYHCTESCCKCNIERVIESLTCRRREIDVSDISIQIHILNRPGQLTDKTDQYQKHPHPDANTFSFTFVHILSSHSRIFYLFYAKLYMFINYFFYQSRFTIIIITRK